MNELVFAQVYFGNVVLIVIEHLVHMLGSCIMLDECSCSLMIA